MSRRAVQIATGLALAGTAAAIWTVAHRLRPGAAPMTQAALRAPPAADAFDTPFVPPPPPPKIPQRLPDFVLPDRSGKPTSIATWRDKSLIINFWATWCAPCRREMPLLASIQRRWAAQGVTVVGIAVDHPQAVRAYADELKIPYPLLVGEQDALDVAAAFGVGSPVFPFTVFTDRRGEVVALYVGELHQAQAELILRTVQDLNLQRVALADARRSIAAGLQSLTPQG